MSKSTPRVEFRLTRLATGDARHGLLAEAQITAITALLLVQRDGTS